MYQKKGTLSAMSLGILAIVHSDEKSTNSGVLYYHWHAVWTLQKFRMHLKSYLWFGRRAVETSWVLECWYVLSRIGICIHHCCRRRCSRNLDAVEALDLGDHLAVVHWYP